MTIFVSELGRVGGSGGGGGGAGRHLLEHGRLLEFLRYIFDICWQMYLQKIWGYIRFEFAINVWYFCCRCEAFCVIYICCLCTLPLGSDLNLP